MACSGVSEVLVIVIMCMFVLCSHSHRNVPGDVRVADGFMTVARRLYCGVTIAADNYYRAAWAWEAAVTARMNVRECGE